jgi:hypothetical protein
VIMIVAVAGAAFTIEPALSNLNQAA